MTRIEVGSARVGMVLAENVEDAHGRLVVPAGKELTASYLGALPSWGITHIDVVDDDGSDPSEARAEDEDEALRQARAELDTRFKRMDRAHPAVAVIEKICAERRAAEIRGAGEAGEKRA